MRSKYPFELNKIINNFKSREYSQRVFLGFFIDLCNEMNLKEITLIKGVITRKKNSLKFKKKKDLN